MKLTNKAIKAFKHNGGWDVRWDNVVSGLGVRVYPSGKKAFVLSYRHRSKKTLMVLGRFGVMTTEQGRIEAGKQLALLRSGIDPIEERRRESRGANFGDLADAYIEDYAKGPRFPNEPRKKTWKEDKRRLDSHVPARWRSRRIDAITRADVRGLHASIGKEHLYEANRVLALLSVVFGYAVKEGFVEEGTPNPAIGIEKFKEKKRKRWVTPEELPDLGKRIDEEENIYIRSALWLYLLTGVRKNELLQARRDDIDWNRGTLTLPDTKAGEEQRVPLSKAAIAVMQTIPAVEGNPFLFPGRRKGRHLVNIDKSWRNIRKKAGMTDVRLHDLRRSVGSWLSNAGVDLNQVKAALRHADLTTTLIYARLGEDPVREVMEDHGRRILEAAGKSRPVAIDGGKA